MDTWGELPKSQVDNNTVDQEIDSKIQTHLDDPDAHLDTGQSLQSHKASTIIDHIARSVVLDKLQDFGRERYSLGLESLDGWDYSALGVSLNVGELNLATSNIINTETRAITRAGAQPTWANDFNWQVMTKYIQDTSQLIYFVCGSIDENAPEDQNVGFKIVNGAVYALHSKTDGSVTTEYTTAVTVADLYALNIFFVDFVSGSHIDFYINDVLVATHSTNLPDPAYTGGGMCDLYIKNTAASDRELWVRQIYFSQAL